MIWDLIAGAAFVLAIAAIMGVFSRKPRTWGYPPVRKQAPLLGVVLPQPRETTESETEQTVD